MTAYVRVRKLADLVAAIDHTGQQVEVAQAANLSVTRVNELYSGKHPVVDVRKARRLEDAVGLPHGSLFVACDSALLAPYIDDSPADTPADSTEPDDESDLVEPDLSSPIPTGTPPASPAP